MTPVGEAQNVKDIAGDAHVRLRWGPVFFNFVSLDSQESDACWGVTSATFTVLMRIAETFQERGANEKDVRLRRGGSRPNYPGKLSRYDTAR